MGITYRFATAEDYRKIIELANYAFDESHHTGDFEKDTDVNSYFPKCLPKLYQNIETAPMHYLAIKDGVFVGNVAMFDLPTVVAGNELNVGGIGTVCTRPGCRREGYMLQLMADVIETAKSRKIDYMVLGGQRQRYQHWGFEYAGQIPCFNFEPGNFRRLFGQDAAFGYTFAPLKRTDEEWIQKERVMRLADGIWQKRPEDLEYAALFSMNNDPYVILKEGSFAGTFMLARENSETASICDLRLADEADAAKMLNDLMKYLSGRKKMRVSLIAPEHRTLLSALYRSADGVDIGWSEMIKILNYEQTIKAYLDYKAGFTELMDGTCVLGFANGEKVKISVKEGKPEVSSCQKTDPDLTLGEIEAVDLLFGTHVFAAGGLEKLPKEAQTWFPLPFFMAMSDEV